MIYITGDTHNILDIGKIEELEKRNILKEDDYIIVVGDFGCPSFCKTLEETLAYKVWSRLPCQVLFIDGNHENFGEINKYPIEEWHGGKIHKLSKNIFHLMRGQIFEIDGKTFFTMGGATSPDRCMRRLGVDYFEEEDCSYAETQEALDNLEKYQWKVDYVLTHTIGTEFLKKNLSSKFRIYPQYYGSINNFLDYVEDTLEFKHWYFGHLHDDMSFEKHTLLYDKIVELN